MMCDFKPGDEVVCIDNSRSPEWDAWEMRRFGILTPMPLSVGSAYTVSAITKNGNGVQILGVPSCGEVRGYTGRGFRSSRFRKVQRRNLTEWLSQKTKFEEPKRIGENA